MYFKVFFILFFTTFGLLSAQEIAVLQYGGGGDWYSNPTSLTNLIQFCNNQLNTTIDKTPKLLHQVVLIFSISLLFI